MIPVAKLKIDDITKIITSISTLPIKEKQPIQNGEYHPHHGFNNYSLGELTFLNATGAPQVHIVRSERSTYYNLRDHPDRPLHALSSALDGNPTNWCLIGYWLESHHLHLKYLPIDDQNLHSAAKQYSEAIRKKTNDQNEHLNHQVNPKDPLARYRSQYRADTTERSPAEHVKHVNAQSLLDDATDRIITEFGREVVMKGTFIVWIEHGINIAEYISAQDEMITCTTIEGNQAVSFYSSKTQELCFF